MVSILGLCFTCQHYVDLDTNKPFEQRFFCSYLKTKINLKIEMKNCLYYKEKIVNRK
jgi:hypothetical protein